jgi:hypothetical protein
VSSWDALAEDRPKVTLRLFSALRQVIRQNHPDQPILLRFYCPLCLPVCYRASSARREGHGKASPALADLQYQEETHRSKASPRESLLPQLCR